MDGQVHQDFLKFKVDHGREYGNSYEELNRLMRFEQNWNMITSHNAGGQYWYSLAINHYADWHPEEFANILITKEVMEASLPANFMSMNNSRQLQPDHPRELQGHGKRNLNLEANDCENWKDAGQVVGVKNQASCGSCWAFAGTAT